MLSNSEFWVGIGTVALLASGPLWFWFDASRRRAKAMLKQAEDLLP